MASPHWSMEHTASEINRWQVTWESRLPATPPPHLCLTQGKTAHQAMSRQRTNNCQMRRARGSNVQMSKWNSEATEASTVHVSPHRERAGPPSQPADNRRTQREVHQYQQPAKYIPLALSTRSAATSQESRTESSSGSVCRFHVGKMSKSTGN